MQAKCRLEPDYRHPPYLTVLTSTAKHFYALATPDDDYYAVIYIHKIDPADHGRSRVSCWRPMLQAYRVFALHGPPSTP